MFCAGKMSEAGEFHGSPLSRTRFTSFHTATGHIWPPNLSILSHVQIRPWLSMVQGKPERPPDETSEGPTTCQAMLQDVTGCYRMLQDVTGNKIKMIKHIKAPSIIFHHLSPSFTSPEVSFFPQAAPVVTSQRIHTRCVARPAGWSPISGQWRIVLKSPHPPVVKNPSLYTCE